MLTNFYFPYISLHSSRKYYQVLHYPRSRRQNTNAAMTCSTVIIHFHGISIQYEVLICELWYGLWVRDTYIHGAIHSGIR